MLERLADLDELVLRCRDKPTKEYIQEAVACYRAGAFRACIVSTWNAVVFDFIHKLRELKQTGHKDAIKKLDEFEALRVNSDVSRILIFEKSVPDFALKDFEFISPLEHSDLKRLYDDRNLCAHPSMRSLEETFPASAELARYHLRNAVVHLLQHPPVQGRAALDTVWEQVKSELFPTNADQAETVLRNGPLARARKPLVRGFIVGLTKSLLLEDRPKIERARQFAALQAVFNINFGDAEEAIKSELSKLIDGVSDEKWLKVVSYLRHIKCWVYFNEVHQTKTSIFVKTVSDIAAVPVLLDALNIKELHAIALEQVKKIDPELLVQNLQNFQTAIPTEEILPVIKDYIQSAVDLFIASSYSGASTNGKKLLQVSPLLTATQLETVLRAFCKNDQINSNFSFPDNLRELFQKTSHLHESVKSSWVEVRIMLNKSEFDEATAIIALKELIDIQLPDLLENSNKKVQEGKA